MNHPSAITPLKGGKHELRVTNKHLNVAKDLQQSPNLPESGGDKQALHRRRHSRGFSKTLPFKKTITEQPVVDPKWTRDQLNQHYSQCLKLSQENKINHKNAFDLHLIDHMQKFIEQDGNTNFMVAGGSIFAGAKIYASRVDALGTMTERLILSLASGGGKDEEGDDGNGDSDDVDGDGKPKPKRRRKNCQVLETQEANLRVTSVPQMCMASLIQRREGRSMDAANCTYLATNQYRPCKDEVGIHYVEESNHILIPHDHCSKSTGGENSKSKEDSAFTNLLNSGYIKQLGSKKNLENVESCADFDFEASNSAVEKPSRLVDDADEPINDFCKELETAAIENDSDPLSQPMACGISDDDVGDDVMTMSDDDCAITQQRHHDIVGDDAEKVSSSSSVFDNGTRCDALDANRLSTLHLGEYSFFAPGGGGTFGTGLSDDPTNWLKMRNARVQALRKKTKESDDNENNNDDCSSNIPPVKKKRKSNQQTGIDLTQKPVTKPVKLNTQRMSKQKKDQMKENRQAFITIEKSEITKVDLLRAMQVRVYIRPLELDYAEFASKQQIEQDELTEAISQTNTAEFCPPLNACDDDAYDGDDDVCSNEGGLIFDPTAPSSSPQLKTHHDEYQDMLGGDHLLQGPTTVETITKFNFNNLNKKMDVKKLKEAMWSDLCVKNTTKKEERRKSISEEKQATNEVDVLKEHQDGLLFSQTYTSLPNKLSSVMRGNLSIPIAFTCLLHLANEKQLEIQSLPDLKDVVIRLPSSPSN